MRRRDFLKATTLAAGVSLLEGCSRREDEVLLQPAMRPDQLAGATDWRHGVCQQCTAGCGIQVRVVDDNVKKIEGNPDHPVNRGGVCALGQSLPQALYDPDRVLVPQRRSGARGAGEFDELSWELGLAELAETIAATPAERLAIIGSERTGLVGALWQRLAAGRGAPAPVFAEAPELEVERRAVAISLGVDDMPYFDLGRTDYALSIGAPFLDRWRSPVHYTRMLGRMRRGRPGRRGKLVHAEPRMSLTAANADEWLAPRPGTEGMLARTIAGVLLADESISGLARDSYRSLFPDDPPTLEQGATACDLPADRIHRIAQELAAADRRLVIAGGSAAAHSNGLFNMVAALGLNLLLDNLGRPGGVFSPASFRLANGVAPADSADNSMADLLARLRNESGDPVEALVIAADDPLHTLPRGQELAEALAGAGKVIVLSSFLDDTAMHADLLLPLRTELERFNAVEPASSIGVPVLGLAAPVVDPLGEGHHVGDVILATAAALGEPMTAELPWTSFAALAQARVDEELARLASESGPGNSVTSADALARGGVFPVGEPSEAPPGPTARAPAATEPAFDGDATRFPFLLQPFESVKLGDGRGANRPWLQELPDPLSTVMWDSWAELSPADAAELGILDGDRLRIESPSGSIEVGAVIDPAVRPGLVGVPRGQGHRDHGRFARGRGANPLDLIGPLQVDGQGVSAWAATRVRIDRLGPGRLTRHGARLADRGAGEHIPVGWAPHPAPPENLA